MTESTTNKKTVYNITAAVVGFLLAGLSIWGIVQSQSNIESAQDFQRNITYDG